MKRLFKETSLCIILLLTVVFIISCTYNPPEGYSRKHHTYEEILDFAKSIDPIATVSKEYRDTKTNDLDGEFREWDAVINGIECHVSSVGDLVWNDGVGAGEFSKVYYVIDTDYDYYLLEKIISEKQKGWRMKHDDIRVKYHPHGNVYIETSYTEKRKLSNEELEIIWNDAYEIYQEYSSYPVRKTVHFGVAAPAVYVDGNGENKHIKITFNYIYDFSEEGKIKFFENYTKAWDLINSGLPVEE